MSLLDTIRRQVVPIHPEGYVFILLFAVAALLLHWLWAPAGWLAAVATLWCAYFFRDPPRVTPLRDGLVVAPADGVVSAVGIANPPPELGLSERPLMRVSIFMSIFDCHVNRAPIAGKLTRVAYKPGLFLNADFDKASEDNERNGMVIDHPEGRFGVVQIAGLVARRIVCFVNEGATIGTGDRIGLIRFGSRVDVYLPDMVTPIVGLGQRTIAGETILADLASREPLRSFKTM